MNKSEAIQFEETYMTSDSLFHITKKEHLRDILKDMAFKVAYCIELIETNIKNANKFSFRVPMVSFFDIPLGKLKPLLNVDGYGNYGIGLNKTWASHNRLSPVIYFDKNSDILCESLGTLYESLLGVKKIHYENSKPVLTPDQIALTNFFRHIKNYEGTLERKGFSTRENYRFSDEREWRYCPTKDDAGKFPYVDDDLGHWNPNDKMTTIELKFTLDDISHIIIENEAEIECVLMCFDKTANSDDSLFKKIILANEILPDAQ